MSRELDERSELIAAQLLQQALEGKETLSETLDEALQQEVEEALGAAAFLKSPKAMLGAEALFSLAQTITQEASLQASALSEEEEQRAADALRTVLEGNSPEGLQASLSLALQETAGAASFVKHTSASLGEDFLRQLGQEVEAEAKKRLEEQQATPLEKSASEIVRRALEGQTVGPMSPEAQKAAEEALGAAAFMKSTASAKLLQEEELKSIGKEVEQEAKARLARRRRTALWGGASLVALAAALLLLVSPIFRGGSPKTFEADFPEPPVLDKEIALGSDPLERLDPVYDAGLKGLREARFLGAHYASANAQ